MDSLIDIAAARSLVADAALWPRVRDFLWDFAPQVHPSWLEGLNLLESLGNLESLDRRALLENLGGNPRVKALIYSKFGIEPCFHAFPKDDWSRLILLDGHELELIVKWLGALSCADSLRRVTDGATVRALKAELSGVYPEVFGYTAYFSGFDLSAKNAMDAKNPEEVVSVGLELLSSLLDACPEPLVTRFKLKLPKKLCERGVANGEKQELISAGGAVKKLLKLKFPEAYRLCC